MRRPALAFAAFFAAASPARRDGRRRAGAAERRVAARGDAGRLARQLLHRRRDRARPRAHRRALRAGRRRVQAGRTRRAAPAGPEGHVIDCAAPAVRSQDHAGAPRHRGRRAGQARGAAQGHAGAADGRPRADRGRRTLHRARLRHVGAHATPTPLRRCARRRSSPPASPAICSFAWSIRRPAASAPGSAPAPATPAARSIRTPAAISP